MKIVLLLMVSMAALSSTSICVDLEEKGELCATKTSWDTYSTYENITLNTRPEWSLVTFQLSDTADSNTICELFGHERPTRFLSLSKHFVCSVIDLDTGETKSLPTYRDCYFPFGYRAVKKVRCI